MDKTTSAPGLRPNHFNVEAEDRRKARLRLVMDQSTPEKFVAAWDFYRNYYLMHEDANFYKGFVEPSPHHWEWAYFRARYRRNAIGAHRGSAKSTIISREFPLMNLCTRPRSDTLLIFSNDGKVEVALDDVQQQLEHNPRIIDDFGRLRPPRGATLWSKHRMRTSIGSGLKGYGYTSDGLRGERPDFCVVDDPEYDPKAGTNVDRVVADMETVLFQVILPMLRLTSPTHLFWIGTPVDKRLFLWKLLKGEDERLVQSLWNRKAYPVVNEKGEAFWPAEYGEDEIKIRQQELGSAYMAEMMLEPGSTEDRCLHMHPIRTDYQLDDPLHEPDRTDPFNAQEVIRWHDMVPQPDRTLKPIPRTATFAEQVSNMRRAITVDYAPTTKASSDWSVIHVLGLDRYNQLWSLDLDCMKVRKNELIKRVWQMALRWQVRLVGIEAVSVQESFALEARDVGENLRLETGYAPQTILIKHSPKVSKEDRIEALTNRFDKGQIKLPRYLERDKSYRQLFSQIRDFTPDGKSLEHDDAIDTLSMYPHVLKGAPKNEMKVVDPSPLDILEAGEANLPDGTPAILGVDLSKLPIDAFHEFVRQNYPEAYERPKGVQWEDATL